jgi:hypothetical protein
MTALERPFYIVQMISRRSHVAPTNELQNEVTVPSWKSVCFRSQPIRLSRTSLLKVGCLLEITGLVPTGIHTTGSFALLQVYYRFICFRVVNTPWVQFPRGS